MPILLSPAVRSLIRLIVALCAHPVTVVLSESGAAHGTRGAASSPADCSGLGKWRWTTRHRCVTGLCAMVKKRCQGSARPYSMRRLWGRIEVGSMLDLGWIEVGARPDRWQIEAGTRPERGQNEARTRRDRGEIEARSRRDQGRKGAKTWKMRCVPMPKQCLFGAARGVRVASFDADQ